MLFVYESSATCTLFPSTTETIIRPPVVQLVKKKKDLKVETIYT